MKTLIIGLVSLLSISCATIPRATSDLSIALGSEIELLEKQHITLLNNYFEQRKLDALTFLDDKWYPNYLNNLFKEQVIIDTWEKIVETTDLEEKIEIMEMLTTVIQEEYMAKRQDLLEPIEKYESEVGTAIREQYTKTKNMNATITSNVLSASDVQAKQKEYLSKVVDVDNINEKVNTSISKLDAILKKIKTK